ncbi:MAG TPA: DNA internalization-related competence protein ComEC/Rec2 [Burkholderiales bacterium]|jgi:competence protein ComEC|nr:DNA internalization-related competence protein ComEC/Rec2 [Burkholderiales bacterium]
MITLLFASAFALGCWWLLQQPILPSWSGIAALPPLVLLGMFAQRRALSLVAAASAAAACALAGFHWAAAVAHWKLQSGLPPWWEGRDVRIEGVVADLPQRSARGSRIRFDVEKVLTPGAIVPRSVILNWYDERSGALPAQRELHAGQRWQLTVRLQRPHGNYNPHGFDLERWLLERGIRATGYVRASPHPNALGESRASPRHLIARTRERVRQRLFDALGEAPYRGLIVALAVGDQQAIPSPQWTLFTRTGVNHLMSISGLHITMVASLLFVAVAAIWRRTGRLAARIPVVRAATAVGLLGALGYALLAGFAVPAQRTVYMLAVIAIALWSGWRWPAASVLGVALVLVVAIDPWAAASAGFWLSFGAVAALTLVGSGRLRPTGVLRAWGRAQWAVSVALVPLLIALFQQVSVISPLANAAAIPLISLIVVPLALAFIVVPLDLLAQGAHAVAGVCVAMLQWLASMPGAAWQQHAPPPWAVAAALLGAGWLLLPRGFPSRWVGAVAMLPLFLTRPAGPAHDEVWITALDVGQGLAVVVRTANRALLFDAGPAYPGGSDAGERVVIPYLRGEGVRALDALIVSHDDTDHAGGASSVLSAMPVALTLSSLPTTHPINIASHTASRCAAGQTWRWGATTFEILHPQAHSYNRPQLKDNDRSCVLRVITPYGAVLIAGDIEQRSERELLAHLPARLSAAILVAPHHGSRTSSGADFVEAVGARHVVFCAGYRNRFGHPHPLVAARYRAAGANLLRTDVSGAVTFRLRPDGTAVEQWRLAYSRFWHGL